MYTIVTGARLIGANIVKALNERGATNIIAVDNLTRADKFKKPVDCEIADYLDKDDFIERLSPAISTATSRPSSTKAPVPTPWRTDGRYMMENNFRYSQDMLDWCLGQKVQFLYASSAATYGGRQRSASAPVREGRSTSMATQIPVRPDRRQRLAKRRVADRRLPLLQRLWPRETHKGRMASVAFHHYNQFRAEQQGQAVRRAATATATASRNATSSMSATSPRSICSSSIIPEKSGIFNLGTGRAQSFNDVAAANVNACRALDNRAASEARSTNCCAGLHRIHPFPEALKGQVPELHAGRSHRLRAAGYERPFATVEEGVAQYVEWLNKHV